jgi:hypothetical protein
VNIITNGSFRLSGGAANSARLVDSRSGARIPASTLVVLSADEMAALLASYAKAGVDAMGGVAKEVLEVAVLAARR